MPISATAIKSELGLRQGLFGLLTIIAGALLFSNAFAAESLPVSQRKLAAALVKQHCSTCHGDERSLKGPHPAAPPLRRLGGRYDFDELVSLFQKGLPIAGHSHMPAFEFSAKEARAISSYLRQIQTR